MKIAPEASAPAAKDAPGDCPASTMSKRDEKKACSLGLIPAEEGNVILPGSASRPILLPAHEFLRRLLLLNGIQLWQLTPNSMLHLAICITLRLFWALILTGVYGRRFSSLSVTIVAMDPLSLVGLALLSEKRRVTSTSQ
jgi:hypothetical protein